MAPYSLWHWANGIGWSGHASQVKRLGAEISDAASGEWVPALERLRRRALGAGYEDGRAAMR